MMSSNAFINYSLPAMNAMYKVFGVKATNLLINKTAGEVFTSGEYIQTLLQDIQHLEKRGIQGVANYVAEGLHEMNEMQIQQIFTDLMDSIGAITEGGKEGHLAIKVTAMIAIDILTRISKAQECFLEQVLMLWTHEDPLSKEQIRSNLESKGIDATEAELEWLMHRLRFADHHL